MKKLILLVSMRNISINVFLFFILINNHSVEANPDILKNKIEPYCNAELSFLDIMDLIVKKSIE